MEGSNKGTRSGIGGCFQMPLHYPRYTRQDYQAMPEWKLDCLLSQYGLLTDLGDLGDLNSKREFAIGAFLWPSSPDQQQLSPPSSSPRSRGLKDSF